MPLKEFLGPYIPPAELTLATLQSVANGNHGSFAATIAAATIKGKAAQSEYGTKNLQTVITLHHARASVA